MTSLEQLFAHQEKPCVPDMTFFGPWSGMHILDFVLVISQFVAD